MLTVALMGTIRLKAQTRLRLSANPLNVRFSAVGDSLQHLRTISRVRNQYLAAGYISFSVDSITWGRQFVDAYLFIGKRFRIGSIQITSDSFSRDYMEIQSRYEGTLYDTASTAKMVEDILQRNENNGYPFCHVKVFATPGEENIQYNLRIERGTFFVFDSIHVDGDNVLKKSFLAAYTGLKKGMPYSEVSFLKANDKLRQLPFLLSERSPQMVFLADGKARPYMYLRKRKSDQVNGILGVAPTNTVGTGTQRQSIVVTGEILLKLNNMFRSAKMLSINWRSFKARSQELKAEFNYPYILGRPVGADIAVNLLKYDTLYTTTAWQLGLQYYTSGINGIKAFYSVSSTNLNSVDTATIRSSKQFPSINAVETKQYGLMINFNLLDYRFNPRKGWYIDGYASAGTKEILKDNLISEVKFGPEGRSLYDSGSLRSTQYQLKMRVDKYFQTGSKTALKIGAYTAHIIAPRIYFNELLREGGINSLKGFNEQSIFASGFNMLEIEYHYLFGVNSYFKVFWNGAYYEDRSFGRSKYVYDTPWGFGVGANIETGAGILTMAYALGKEKSNKFDLRTGKIHFGLSSYF